MVGNECHFGQKAEGPGDENLANTQTNKNI